VLSISRGLAKRVAGSGATVNAVLPGPTLSEGVEAMLKESAEKAGLSIEEAGTAFVKANRPSSIIQRPATVDEVANMVVYVPRPRPPPPQAQRFGSTVAWSTRSPERT
jgi:NAD(P)-dependent dehydrogenase (short-subunit alcohol dehydrogenase family)